MFLYFKIKTIRNSFEFGKDSLFCEYAYVFNLNNKSIDIYKGCQNIPNIKGDIFFANDPDIIDRRSRFYYGCKLLLQIKFCDIKNMNTISEVCNNINTFLYLKDDI